MSSKASQINPFEILGRLVVVTVFSIGLAYFMATTGPGFFKWFEAKIDIKNPIGFSVILFLSVLCQILVWSLPALIPAALVRSLVRCVGVWFDFSLRMVLLVLLEITIYVIDKIYVKEIGSAGLDEAKNGIVYCFKNLFGVLTLDIVERLADSRYLFQENIYNISTYALFLLLLTGFIRKVFLSDKTVQWHMLFFLILVVTSLSSYLFMVIDPFFSAEWKKPVLMTSFWIVDTVITPLQIFRVSFSWLSFLFCALIIDQVSPVKKEEISEVASPVFTKPYQQ